MNSRIGLGGIPIQKLSKEESYKFLNFCLENNISFIDTARGYTVSEEYIGYFLKENRQKIFLATKSLARKKEAFIEELNTSYKLLQTDYIDLFQVHNIRSKEDFLNVMNEVYPVLDEYKKLGKILHIGLTSHSNSFLDWFLDSEFVNYFYSIQAPLNFIEKENIPIFKKAKEKNLKTITMKPLAGGVIDNGSIAIKYLLNISYVDMIIPGMSLEKEVIENTSVVNQKLTEEEIFYIEKLRKENEGEFCHRCGYCLPCVNGIDIPSIMTLEKYYQNYGLENWAISRYKNLNVSCINCRACVSKCPYNIDIPKKLEGIKKLLKKDET